MKTKTTSRFDKAVSKLYSAFHEGRLNAYDCTACAVGNICDGESYWALLRVGRIGILSTKEQSDRVWKNSSNKQNFLDSLSTSCEIKGLLNSTYEDSLVLVEKTGYSAEEIITVEKIFMDCFPSSTLGKNKETQFKGLCAVIEYLAELDGIPNPMDYTKLFERTKEGAPKFILEDV